MTVCGGALNLDSGKEEVSGLEDDKGTRGVGMVGQGQLTVLGEVAKDLMANWDFLWPSQRNL